jgi:hypothetical protein
MGIGDLTAIVQNGVTKKLPFSGLLSSLQSLSDSLYVKYRCHKIKGESQWYFSGDTIYLDTCNASAHGSLTGLDQDDHLQYPLLSGRASDILLIDSLSSIAGIGSPLGFISEISVPSSIRITDYDPFGFGSSSKLFFGGNNDKFIGFDDPSSGLELRSDGQGLIFNYNLDKLFYNGNLYPETPSIDHYIGTISNKWTGIYTTHITDNSTDILLKVPVRSYDSILVTDFDTIGKMAISSLPGDNLGNHTATANLNMSSYSVTLPLTTSSLTGVIYKGADRFIHTYQGTGLLGQIFFGNTFVGIGSGNFTMAKVGPLTPQMNTGIGYAALSSLTTGSVNMALGQGAMAACTSGKMNVAVGAGTLGSLTSGISNVAIGQSAGSTGNGSRNIFIGYAAGTNEAGSDKLYIEPSNSASPLIYGDFAKDSLVFNGDVFIVDSVYLMRDAIRFMKTEEPLEGFLTLAKLNSTGKRQLVMSTFRNDSIEGIETPLTISDTNYTSSSGSQAIAFIDLTTHNDTLFLGSATTRLNDMIYVARTDYYANSVVINSSSGIYYKSRSYSNMKLGKTMTGAILQSDGMDWYVTGVFFDQYATPTMTLFPDSTSFNDHVQFNSSIYALNIDSASNAYALYYDKTTGNITYDAAESGAISLNDIQVKDYDTVLVINNDTVGKKVITAGLGYSLQFSASSFSLIPGSSYYFGMQSGQGSTNSGKGKVYVPKSGTIKTAYVYWERGAQGTYSSGTFYVKVGVNQSYTTIEGITSLPTNYIFKNTDLNVSVSQGDWLEIQVISCSASPYSSTNLFSGVIYIE